MNKAGYQRLILSSFGVAIIAGSWRWAVNHLYTMPEHSIQGFTSITNNSFYVIAAIVIFMVTGRLIYDWKNTTSSTISQVAEHITEKRTEKIEVDPEVVRAMAERYSDDPSYRPIDPDEMA